MSRASGSGPSMAPSTFANAAEQKTFKLAIHSKRAPGADELYTLRLNIRAADNSTLVQTMPIRVQQDQKTALEPTIPINFDYRYDNITGYFNNAEFRTEYAVINLDQLESVFESGATVNAVKLRAAGRGTYVCEKCQPRPRPARPQLR